MKKIWLVRHGQSRSQGAEDDDVVDPALSELGRRQAARLVEPLQNLELDDDQNHIIRYWNDRTHVVDILQ